MSDQTPIETLAKEWMHAERFGHAMTQHEYSVFVGRLAAFAAHYAAHVEAQRPSKVLDTEGWESITSSVPSEGEVVTVCHDKGGWVLHDVLYNEGKFTERVRTQVGGDAAYVSKERVPGPVVFPTHWLQWKNRHLAPAQPLSVDKIMEVVMEWVAREANSTVEKMRADEYSQRVTQSLRERLNKLLNP